jgi:hypothetical protein
LSAERDELLKKVKFNRYAKGDPKRALLQLMDEVSCRVHRFRKDVWNVTVELLGDHLGLMENPWKYSLPGKQCKSPISKPSYSDFGELKRKISPEMIEAYIVAAKAKPWDHLGEIFVEEELAGRKNSLGQCLTPRGIVDMMCKMTIEPGLKKPYSFGKPDFGTLVWQTAEALDFNSKLSINLQVERARRHTVLDLTPLLVKYEPKPITVIDPAGVGTGRFLLGATLMFPKAPLILYGIEIDLSLYRACLVNMALFSNHPYAIICADALMLSDRHCLVGGDVWDVANRWDPPDMTPYYFKSEPQISPFRRYMQSWKTKNPEIVQTIETLTEKPIAKKPELVAPVETKNKSEGS